MNVCAYIVVELLSCVWLFCDPMDCNPPGSSVHGIFQARILEWVAISFSRGSSPPRDRTPVSCIDRWILYHRAPWEAHVHIRHVIKKHVKSLAGKVKVEISFFSFSFIFISWRLITLQYCSGFCHTLTWISHGVTCIPHPDPLSHLPLHLIPLGLPSAPGPSTCLMHPTWASDLFHYR